MISNGPAFHAELGHHAYNELITFRFDDILACSNLNVKMATKVGKQDSQRLTSCMLQLNVSGSGSDSPDCEELAAPPEL